MKPLNKEGTLLLYNKTYNTHFEVNACTVLISMRRTIRTYKAQHCE